MRCRPVRTLLATTALVATTGLATATAAEARSCEPIRNPYAGTEYDGADLTGIRATNTTCATARRTVRGAHQKALSMTPTGPVRRYRWNGWRVTGDLRGDRDTYTARKGSRVVRWRF